MNSKGLYKEEIEHRKKILKNTQEKSFFDILFSEFFSVSTLIIFLPLLIFLLNNLYTEAIVIFILYIITFAFRVIIHMQYVNFYNKTNVFSRLRYNAIRNNLVESLDITQLVVGDYLLLEKGDIIPAELKIVKSNDLIIASNKNTKETTLKQAEDIVPPFAIIRNGSGEGILLRENKYREFSKAKKLYLRQDKIYKKIKLFEFLTFLISLIIVGSFFIYMENPYKEAINVIGLFVSLQLTGLPYIYLAYINNLNRENKEVITTNNRNYFEKYDKKPVLLLNKDLFIDENSKTVATCFTNNKYYKTENEINKNTLFIKSLILSSTSTNKKEDSVFENYAINNGYNVEDIKKQYVLLKELKYSPERNIGTVLYKYKNSTVSFTRGLTKYLIPKCKYILINGELKVLTDELKNGLVKISNALIKKGIKVYSVGMRMNDAEPTEIDLIFLGFAGIKENANNQAHDIIQKLLSYANLVLYTNEEQLALSNFIKENNLTIADEQILTSEKMQGMTDVQLAEENFRINVLAGLSINEINRFTKSFKQYDTEVNIMDDDPEVLEQFVDCKAILVGEMGTESYPDIMLKKSDIITFPETIKKFKTFNLNLKKAFCSYIGLKLANFLFFFIICMLNFKNPLNPLIAMVFNIPILFFMAFLITRDSIDKQNETLLIKIPFVNSLLFAATLWLPYIVINLLSDNNIFTINNALENDLLFGKFQSMFLIVYIIMTIIVHLMNRETVKTIFNINLFNNKLLLLALLIVVIMGASFIFVKPLAIFFGFEALTLNEIIYMISISFVPLFTSEFFKFIKSFKK